MPENTNIFYNIGIIKKNDKLLKKKIIDNINAKKYFSNNNNNCKKINIFILKGNLYIKVKAKKNIEL